MEDQEKYLTLIDENEKEILAEILFTFEKNNKNFVLLVEVLPFDDPSEGEDNVLAYQYLPSKDSESIGELIEINDDDDWETVEEMFNTFYSDES